MPKGLQGFQKGNIFGQRLKGRHLSPKTEFKKDHKHIGPPPPSFKGYHHTIETKKKLSFLFSGEKNPTWKGNKCSYGTMHDWVRKHLGTPSVCENCNKSGLKGRQIHWANKSKKYKRNLRDWIRLCQSCHQKWDRGIIELNVI